MLQTKEEREAAAEAARKEREAAEAKAKAKEDKEKAMKEFAATMAKVRCAWNNAVSLLVSASAPDHPSGVSTQRGLGSCASVLRSTRAALSGARHFTAHCGRCCSLTSHQQARLQAKEAADKEKADEASGKAAGEESAPADTPATEEAAKQQAEAEGKTVEVQPELPADAAPETGACCQRCMGLSRSVLRMPDVDLNLQHGCCELCLLASVSRRVFVLRLVDGATASVQHLDCTAAEDEDRPATLAKSQDAAAARAQGEEIGSTGGH
jgi:hypothetical protein